jgi:hypothetical protein
MNNLICVICKKYIKTKLTYYTFYCNNCNHWQSNLKKNINSSSDLIFNNGKIENNPIYFLNNVKIKSAHIILNTLKKLGGGGGVIC